ncbi:MAG: S8 family serine peptidase [Pseudomonadota bacterium]
MTNSFYQDANSETTGRAIIRFRENASINTIKSKIKKLTGRETISSSDYETNTYSALGQLDHSNAFLIEELKLTLLDEFDKEDNSLQMLSRDRGIGIRPEYYMYPITQLSYEERLKAWYHEGISLLNEQIHHLPSESLNRNVETFHRERNYWNLEATNVLPSDASGKGIKVAILDTGLNIDHPDFKGRNIEEQSFVSGERNDIKDYIGHGTHCTGIAVGPKCPSSSHVSRYGIAYEADIYAGKVLAKNGKGSETEVIMGILAAIKANCDIISLSLGMSFPPEGYDITEYERIAKRALDNDCIIVAASGNDSERSNNIISRVNVPACANKILAVGALDQKLNIADFSSGSEEKVDIYAPGVNIVSAGLEKSYYKDEGTSMAAPHVAGIAALIAESDPHLRGETLLEAVQKSVQKIEQDSKGASINLVSAP